MANQRVLGAIGGWCSLWLFWGTTFGQPAVQIPPVAKPDAGQAAPSGAAQTPSVFELPRLQLKYVQLLQETAVLLQQGDYAEAEKRCAAAVALVPHDVSAHYNLACTQARQNKTEAALSNLERAVALGFRGAAHMKQDPDLAQLREQERFQKALAAAGGPPPAAAAGWKYTIDPAAIENGVALVSEQNTAWDQALGVFRPLFKIDTAPPATNPIIQGFGPAGDLLRKWQAEGTAAGNHGDLYDNHDTDHSNMDFGSFPQLTRIKFSEAVKSRGFHHGLQAIFLYNGVTLGNSSTALVSGPFWRSQARLALTNPRTAALLHVQYFTNHLFVYPEHRDHDPGHNGQNGQGHGDVFAVNSPYLLISQGSSGSDRDFLHAVAATLAALRPDVKAELTRTGALMPTVQMILRTCYKPVATPADYLTGSAHPTVFEGSQLDLLKMVQLAHELTREMLPPVVQLKAVEEDQGVVGRDYLDIPRPRSGPAAAAEPGKAPGSGAEPRPPAEAGDRERLLDLPCVIARVFRTTRYVRRMVVSAEASKDLNKRPLTYHWAVLRGDAEQIKINKLNPAGSVVELLVPYHPRRPIAPGHALESNRVDIGVFVHNGTYYSAPAFVTHYYLDNEKREYDQQHRILSVDYNDPQVSKNYVEPAVDLPKNWRDAYHYDAAGKLTGWTRHRGPLKEEFTAEGLLVTKTDPQGRPLEARRVTYAVQQHADRPPTLQEVLTDELVPLDPNR